MFEFAGMSPSEIQFIRLYVHALRRDYYLLRSVLDLMHPKNLSVSDFVSATNAAIELDEMHADFEKKISLLQKKHNFRNINAAKGPTVGELADMFSLSFFKVVNVEENEHTGKKIKTDDGWFSGKPTEWQKTIADYKNAAKNTPPAVPDLLSDFFNLALKFFPFNLNHKKWHDIFPGHTKKLWPPQNKYKDEDEQYFDDDDDDMSSFGVAFDDDE